MMGRLSRRSLLLQSAAALTLGATLGAIGTPLLATQGAEYGIAYLESLGRPGALRDGMAFIPPSQIDEAYSHVLYVNTSTSGGGGQKMWVLERRDRQSESTQTASLDFGADLVRALGQGKGDWRVAIHDPGYWARRGLPPGAEPPYSWPVSTGRHYPGDRRSGPTPLGIFNVDDRNHRHRRGWGSPGMYNSIYIDLHYSSGRASGVAMHGTTGGMYSRLGRADSHGCIRMTQTNADQIWAMFHPGGAKGAGSPLWGEVPRYFSSAPAEGYQSRHGYVRDGSFLYDSSGQSRLMKNGYTALFIFFRDDL